MTAARTGPCRKGQRHDAKRKCQRSHHDRTETEFRSFYRGFGVREAFVRLDDGKFHNQNRVFRRQADQGDQPDLEIQIVGQAARPCRQQSAGNRKRNGQQNDKRQRPFFILRRQNQENHNQTENKRLCTGSAGQLFLISRTNPGQRVIRAQNVVRDTLHFGNRLTRAVARRRITQNFRGREDVEAVDQFRTRDTFNRHQRIKRHHGAGV